MAKRNENLETLNSHYKANEDVIIQYNTNKFNFNKVLTNLFNVSSLENIHNEVGRLEGFDGDVGKDSQSNIHHLFYRKIKNEDSILRKLWDCFLSEVVLRNFVNEESYIVQKLPNIRIHIPGSKAINRWHCDSDQDHRHPLGEINCILPLTEMYESNSVWRESKPNLGDFEAFKLSFGDLVLWNGNTCIHGNKVNKTDITRVSFDFRLLSKKNYENMLKNQGNNQITTATMKTKFLIGSYYREF